MDSHFLGEYQIRGDLSDFQSIHNILIEGKTSKYNWLSHYWKKGVKFQSILGVFFAEKTIYFAFKYLLSDQQVYQLKIMEMNRGHYWFSSFSGETSP